MQEPNISLRQEPSNVNLHHAVSACCTHQQFLSQHLVVGIHAQRSSPKGNSRSGGTHSLPSTWGGGGGGGGGGSTKWMERGVGQRSTVLHKRA